MKRSGFTLIELLIVVAIIAILAAIAVPNFLEAQVRAKISRVKSDQRTMAVSLESYAVDNNKIPFGYQESRTAGLCQSMGITNKVALQARLTTPVAYQTSLYVDPFREKGAVNTSGGAGTGMVLYDYESYICPAFLAANATPRQAHEQGYDWVLWSIGPKRVNSGLIAYILLGTAGLPNMASSGELIPRWVYDPSNGTTSAGIIMRTNKGIFTQPGS